jgi:hypothetical protein
VPGLACPARLRDGPGAPTELEGDMSMSRAYAWSVAVLIWSVVLVVAAARFT